MATPAKKLGLFSRMESREDAIKMARDAAFAFLFVAGLQGLSAMLLAPSAMIDAIVLAVLALILLKWHSRAASVLLLLVSLAQAGVTIGNQLGITHIGGKNIYLAIIMVMVGVRAVEATYKLHGRFKPQPARRMPTRAAA